VATGANTIETGQVMDETAFVDVAQAEVHTGEVVHLPVLRGRLFEGLDHLAKADTPGFVIVDMTHEARVKSVCRGGGGGPGWEPEWVDPL
jgi:hypothetical protein